MRRRRVVVVESPQTIHYVSASSDGAWWVRPEDALKPDETSMWNARSFAPAWIMLDIREPGPCLLRLLPSMEPKCGACVHEIWTGEHPDRMRLAATVREACCDRVWVERPLTLARFVKVLTVASPSWVAWIRICVIRKSI